MQIKLLKSKLHLAAVSGSDLNYHGSLTIDPDLMEAVGILPYELILVANTATGSRAETYALSGVRGAGQIELNGAMARLGGVGDRVIVMAFASMTPEEARGYRPSVVALDERNRIVERLDYSPSGLVHQARGRPCGPASMCILIQIPNTPIRIFGFGVMMILALWSSLWTASRRSVREGLNPDLIADMAFWVIIFGLVGARITYVVGEWGKQDMRNIWDALAIWRGGIVLYGSILGGAAGFLWYRRMRPFPILPAIDVIAPSLALGIAFGRLGCFLNGCCYGDRCGMPWSVTFPAKSFAWWDHVDHGWILETAGRSLPVHPTQLYSALDGFLLLALLTAYFPVRRRDGEVMALLMVTLPITRFLIEILRDDDPVVFAQMTIAQLISVAIFTGGLAFWGWLSTRPVGTLAGRTAQPMAAPATA